jgi:hypothetical protein
VTACPFLGEIDCETCKLLGLKGLTDLFTAWHRSVYTPFVAGGVIDSNLENLESQANSNVDSTVSTALGTLSESGSLPPLAFFWPMAVGAFVSNVLTLFPYTVVYW